MKIIKQRIDKDCVYACIAMVCGVTLDEVMKVARGNYALGQEEEFELIAHFRHLPTLVTFERITSGNIYIATVPSLNILRGNHRIVITTINNGVIEIYDPNKGRQNRKYYDNTKFKCWTQLTKITKYKNEKN